jgi:hypothetical protein
MSTIKVNTVTKRTGSTLTLGESGTTVTLACGATQTGFGRTGTVDWCTTAKTSPFTSESGKGYFVNTTSGAVTVTLPASPSAGDIVSIKDYAGTFDTNLVTVGRNGSKINGLCFDASLNTEGDSITLVYVDGTQGWLNIQTDDTVTGSAYIEATGGTITTCGDFKIHTFTSSDNFVVTSGGAPCGSNSVEYLVVAGGGASGADNAPSGASGGGGGGGFRFASPSIAPLTYPAKPLAGPANLPVTAQSYPVTVGSGGSATALACATSTQKGNNSVFSTITSTGGGGGGQYYTCGGAPTYPNYFAGGPGGSGGGSTGEPPTYAGGTGNDPPVNPAQGTNGGLGVDGSPSTDKGGGGGGGSTAAGGNASLNTTSGVGGAGGGLPTAFGANGEPCGSFRYYAGGGGGGIASAMPTGGAGGLGGGGDAGNPGANPLHPGQAGTANTGGGGGGNKVCAAGNGQNGGSGIVVIRYKFQN